ncbi:MAG: helix-turn-helix domain-containing protein [Candidatus Cohnella colombiensis]|uniref:Helix-turn-helix domain-containing protein n=1 Tax=Candidatus Cohnella colombiensis TaxID=3121368 RepID=A0AA95JDA2_9BACL|nr:MAG: helix-turn-helix domain-containing protein [Cohnella sp.]
MKKADVILHPIRMRMIQVLINGAKMSTGQIQERIADVPQATLYRHLKKLVDAGVLIVAEEVPIRGTIEKIYALPAQGAELSAEEIQSASVEDHFSLFVKFAAHLIGEYGAYLDQPNFDLYKDGVSFRQISLNLSDDENLELLSAIKQLLLSAMNNEQNEERRTRLFSVIDFPQEARK